MPTTVAFWISNDLPTNTRIAELPWLTTSDVTAMEALLLSTIAPVSVLTVIVDGNTMSCAADACISAGPSPFAGSNVLQDIALSSQPSVQSTMSCDFPSALHVVS
ncbi:MAG TPA: hypothetical protein VGF94_16780 [Kofleriaceae bacterium]